MPAEIFVSKDRPYTLSELRAMNSETSVAVRTNLKYHPIFSPKQEVIIFQYLQKDPDSTISALLQDSQFWETVINDPHCDRNFNKWIYVLATSDTVNQLVIRCHERFLNQEAHRFQKGKLSFCDAVSEGRKGLYEAIDRFDLRHGNRFYTYARPWVKLEMQNAFCREHNISRTMYSRLLLVNSWRKAFISCEGREPKDVELRRVLLANERRIPIERLDELLIRNAQLYPFSANQKRFRDSDDEIIDDFEDAANPSINDGSAPEVAVIYSDEQAELRHLLTVSFFSLPLDLRTLLEQCSGLFGDEEKLETIAAKEGTTVRALEEKLARALSILRKNPELQFYRLAKGIPLANGVIFDEEQQSETVFVPLSIKRQLENTDTIEEKIRILRTADMCLYSYAEMAHILSIAKKEVKTYFARMGLAGLNMRKKEIRMRMVNDLTRRVKEYKETCVNGKVQSREVVERKERVKAFILECRASGRSFTNENIASELGLSIEQVVCGRKFLCMEEKYDIP